MSASRSRCLTTPPICRRTLSPACGRERRLAVSVVDLLELVDVDREQRRAFSVATRSPDLLVEVSLKAPPVAGSGQQVVLGEEYAGTATPGSTSGRVIEQHRKATRPLSGPGPERVLVGLGAANRDQQPG